MRLQVRARQDTRVCITSGCRAWDFGFWIPLNVVTAVFEFPLIPLTKGELTGLRSPLTKEMLRILSNIQKQIVNEMLRVLRKYKAKYKGNAKDF